MDLGKAALHLVSEGGHDLGKGFSKPRDQHVPNHEGGKTGQQQVSQHSCSTDNVIGYVGEKRLSWMGPNQEALGTHLRGCFVLRERERETFQLGSPFRQSIALASVSREDWPRQ